jgi:hypothetical protein
MNFRRKGRPPTRGGWTKESSAKAHAAKARKRMESPREDEPRRVPDRELLYTIQIQESSGQARKWVIRQGPRANNIRVFAKGREVVCGWDKLMRSLRHNLSIKKVVFG